MLYVAPGLVCRWTISAMLSTIRSNRDIWSLMRTGTKMAAQSSSTRATKATSPGFVTAR